MYRRRFAFALVVVLVALLCGACTGGDISTPVITSSIVAPSPTQPTEPPKTWIKINSVMPSSSSVNHYGDSVMANVTWSITDEDWTNIIKETGRALVFVRICPALSEESVATFCPGVGFGKKYGDGEWVDGILLKNTFPDTSLQRTTYFRVFLVPWGKPLFPTDISLDLSLTMNFPINQVNFMATESVPWDTRWVAP